MKLYIVIAVLFSQSSAIKLYGSGNGKDPMGIHHNDGEVESV